MGDAPHALHGLYGGRAARESADATVRALTGTGERPQEVYTPQSVVDGLLMLWPDGIDLDPCTGPESIVPARLRLDGLEDRNGLDASWSGNLARTCYCNPPFKYLGRWMEKVTDEAAYGVEIVLMCPVRTQRVWWRRAARLASHACWINSNFSFRGYDQNVPFPLALLYYGTRPRSEFRAAFEHLGDVSGATF